MIHAAYRLGSGDGFYVKLLGTSMLSMFENTQEKVTIHIMHNDTLTPDNIGKLCYIAGQYHQQIEFHNVEKIAAESLKKIKEAHPPRRRGISDALWYPFILHEVFPNLDKLIFLGADTLFNLDVEELWSYSLEDLECPIAAVSEYFMKGSHEILPISREGYAKHEKCINSDVLLVKPSLFHEKFDAVLDACRFIYKKKNYFLYDQDVLNYLFAEKCLQLPSKFNVILGQLRMYKPKPYHLEKAIYHFNITKPYFDTNDIYNKLYFEYFLKTPWANADMFGNLDRAFRKQFDRVKTELLRYTNLLAKRERVFVIDKNKIEKMCQIFAITDDESIIDASDPEAMKIFLEISSELKGKKIIYLLSNNWLKIKIDLLQRKLIEGEDFLIALIFLSEKDGGNFLHYDSREMFREM